MSSFLTIIQRVASLSAKVKILQDKVSGGGIQSSIDLINDKFNQFNLDSTISRNAYEIAQESTFTRIELENLSANQEAIDKMGFEESANWQRFRGTYE